MLVQTNGPMDSRGVQKSKKFYFNCVELFFPLYSISGVSTNHFRPLDRLEDPALAPKIIQRKFQNIQRKILKVSILIFWSIKPINKIFKDVGLHSWSPDGFFDTHIAISICDMCWMVCASNMTFLAFLT